MTWWRKREDDLDRELRAHVELEAEECGGDRMAARRALGNATWIKEETRRMWGWNSLATFWQDARYGARLVRRTPVFSLFAMASLALGIGATGAIFSLYDALVLRALPVPQADRLVTMSFAVGASQPNNNMPYPHFAALRERSTTLSGLFAYTGTGRINVVAHGVADLASGLYASGGYYSTLRLQPALGRLLTEEDDHAGNPVAVLSYAYWQRRFGGRPDVLGIDIAINEVSFTVVGVEPRGYFGPEVGRISDLTIPLHALERLNGRRPWNEAFSTWLLLVGRLQDSATFAEAQQELNFIYRQVNVEAATNSQTQRMAREANLTVEPAAGGGISGLRDGYQRWLRLSLMLLGAVLLLASLNLATLLLSRSEARRSEILTRLALGAPRNRVARQLITESMLLAATGGTAGLALAWWGSGALLRTARPGFSQMPVDLTPNLRLIAFTLGLSALTCLLFGVVPALRSTSARMYSERRSQGRRERRLFDRGLVATQVAVSLVLVVFAGLFLRTMQNLWKQDTGYDRRNVLMFSVDAGLIGRKGAAVGETYRRILEALETLPQAQSVSASVVRPVDDGAYFVSVVTAIGQQQFPDQQGIRIAYNQIAPRYFATLGVRLLAGRDFDWRDDVNAPKTAIISETMARRRFLNQDPVGQQITLAGNGVCTIVGVAKDMRYANVKDTPRDVVYRPLFQDARPSLPTFEIRYAGPTADAVNAARASVAATDPALTPFRIKTLERQTQESLAREEVLAMLTTYGGAFAVLLACVGLYGLMTYSVAQRTGELGLRMALGAQPRQVRWMVLRENAATVLVGVVAGLGGAAFAARLVRAQLFGLDPQDPATLAISAAILLVMALGAAYLPATRASRVDPIHALRHE
ncbi:MAG TPA: ABC transporter permease [Bryobacteraceae bacterium]|nr:ABC transporter permease [Bryobacteraceae bacterium]